MVQSHGIRGGVVNLAPMTLGSSSMVGGWGTSGLHGRLHAFVKRALLQQLVTPGASVCDLFCGRGTDTGNWAQAGIGNYIGIDLSASALEEAKEQWDKHCQPFPATFHELDPCTGNLELLQDAGLPVDVVTCFAHLQDYFASEDMVRLLLRNVVSLLKPGGYFFGTTPDSSTIWYKYQKAVEEAMKVGSLRVNGTLPRVRSPLYTITFEDDRFQFFGSKYQLRFVDGLPAQMQQLVHFPSFIRLAEEVGLEYVEIQNLTEFYDDYRVPFASTLQSSCKNLLDQKGQPMVDSRGKLSMVATDVLSLYSTFIFKRSARVVRPASYLDFQLDTEYLFGRDLEKSSLKSECSPGVSLRFSFTPEPSPRDSSPIMKREGFSLFSGEEYMSSQEDLFDRAPTREEFPEYIIQDSGSPTGRIETSHPEQVTDTPDSDQLFPVVDFPCDKDPQLDFQETDHVAEDKSADLKETDRSVTAISPTVEGVGEQQEQREETEALAGEECEQPQADEVPLDENLLIEEVSASSLRTRAPKKARLKGKKKKRTARFCPTVVDLAVTGQTCSINYQSEVEQEQEVMDEDLEVSVPAPPPFLFYQRKKRTEAGLSDAVVQESSVSTNTGNLRALRPRRSSSVGDPKSAPALMAKGARSSKVDNNSRAGSSGSLIFTEEEPGGFSSDGALAGGRGGVPGKAGGSTATLKEGLLPAQASHDAVANGRRSTRSCSSNIVQGIGECRKGTTSESSPMVIRMTRMRSSKLRSSF